MERFEFIGNLGKDAIIKTKPSGMRYAVINVAVKRVRNGEQYTFWHNNIEIYGSMVDYAERYFKKGSTLFCSCTTDNVKCVMQNGDYIYVPVFILQSFEFVGKNTSEQEPVFGERGNNGNFNNGNGNREYQIYPNRQQQFQQQPMQGQQYQHQPPKPQPQPQPQPYPQQNQYGADGNGTEYPF